MTALQSKPEFPNETWAVETKKKAEEVANQVNNASQTIVRSQRDCFVWGDAFSKEFRDNAAAKPPAEWDDEFVDEFIDVMPTEINRLKTVMGAAPGPNQPGVAWDDEDFNKLLNGYNGLADRKWDTPERKSRITALMQGYWLYENLAEIIAEANRYGEQLAKQQAADGTEEAYVHDPFNLPIHNVSELAIESGATLNPQKWRVAGGEPVTPEINVPPVEGYVAKPVRIKVRMDIDRLAWLLAACANAELPFDVLGVRFEKPRRLAEAEPLENQRTRPGARPGGGFQRNRIRNAAAAKDQEEEEEEEAPEFGRGTLVEVYGVVYVAEEKDFSEKIADLPRPDGGALVQR
jgi:hypothetical protein